MSWDVKEQFRRETADHELTVLRDDGVYRHLRCRKPGTRIWGWDVVTWPDHLAVSGDLGHFVFTREHDMLMYFFRGNVNPSYWLEKCVSWDRNASPRGVVSMDAVLKHFPEPEGRPFGDDLFELEGLDGTKNVYEAVEILTRYDSDAWDWNITEPDPTAVRILHCIHWTRDHYLKETTS